MLDKDEQRMLHLYLEVDTSAAFLQRLQQDITTRDQRGEEHSATQGGDRAHDNQDETTSDKLEDAIASSPGTTPSPSAPGNNPTATNASPTIEPTDNTHSTQPNDIPPHPPTTAEPGFFNASQKFDVALLARDIGEWDASDGFPWESVIKCLESSMLHIGSSLHARALAEGVSVERSGFLV